MADGPVRVGLIGFGLAGGSFHAPLIAAEPRLALVAVATSRRAEVEARHPDAAVHAEPGSLIGDPAVELVVIAGPNSTHASFARAALQAGKHVVVDKPFVLDIAEGEALAALARRRSLVLTVFHNRRWDADFLTVRKLFTTGALGDVHDAVFAWDRFRPTIKPGWREEPGDGAGLLADLGPHLADQALLLFGPPKSVTGDLALQRPRARVDDWFSVTLHDGGRRVTLAASTLAAAPRPRFMLHGTRGSFVKYGIDPQEGVLRAGGAPGDAGFGIEPQAAWGRLVSAGGESTIPSERGDWAQFYVGVAAAVRDGALPPVTAADALLGLKLLDLARRSAALGRTLAWDHRDA